MSWALQRPLSLLARLTSMFILSWPALLQEGGIALEQQGGKVLFLYTLMEHYPIYLTYALAGCIVHKGEHICLGVIFIGPYITRRSTPGQEVASGTSLLGLDTLWLMRIVVHHRGCFILTLTTKQSLLRCEDADDESDDKSRSDSYLPSTINLPVHHSSNSPQKKIRDSEAVG